MQKNVLTQNGVWTKGTTQDVLIGEFTDHISINWGIKYYHEGK